MSDIDKDLQRRLKGFADGISPEPGRSAVVVRKARGKRRLVALGAGLVVVALIGGLAGASTLLGDDGITPAPGLADVTVDLPVVADFQLESIVPTTVLSGVTSSRIDVGRRRAAIIAIERPQISAGCMVSAQLRLFIEEASANAADQLAIYPSHVFNAADKKDGERYGYLGTSLDNRPRSMATTLTPGWSEWDVTDITRLWLSGQRFPSQGARAPNEGPIVLALRDLEGAEPFGTATFTSTDANANRPYLVITQTRDCAQRVEPGRTFARYFFEVSEGDASASGVLEVNSAEPSLCLNLGYDNVLASHLLIDDVDHPRGRSIIFTFFDPNGSDGDEDTPFSEKCFRGDRLEEIESELQQLVEEPETFAIDFHRGPDDEPGLVAELGTSPDETVDSACGGAKRPSTSFQLGLPLRVVEKQGEEVIEIVFADGSTADLLPGELLNPALTMPFDKLRARPNPAGGPVGRMSRPGIFYGGIPSDYRVNEVIGCVEGPSSEPVPVWDSYKGKAIVLRFDRWHLFIHGPLRSLEVWAEELVGAVRSGGWLVLRGGNNLKIGPENNPGDAPLILDGSDRHSMRLIELWPRDCSDMPGPDEAKIMGTETFYSQFCLRDANIEVHVTSDVPEFTESVRNELRARNVELVHPLNAYMVQP